MEMKIPDKCALCRQQKELRDSHFVPRSIYGAIRAGMADDLSSPISVDLTKGRSFTSDSQPSTYLLCAECEDKFNRNGERTVLSELRRKTGFKLRDKVMGGVDHVCARDLSRFSELKYAEYAYFSISIAWRGSVYNWKPPHHLMVGKLGPYEECFRAWLNGESGFPKKTYVEIIADTDSDSPALGHPNISVMNDLGSMRVYQFIALGVWFRVHVGGEINKKGNDAFRDGPMPVAFKKMSFGEFGITELAMGDFRSTTPAGKLKKVMKKRSVFGVRG